LAIACVISAATLVLDPSRLASAQSAAPSWTYTGNLNSARANHSATLLQNGKVLVAGGRNSNAGSSVVNSAELYDSSTRMWTGTGNLNTSRFAHTAALLPNGKVLVLGGYDGSHPLNILNSAELYDPATGTWSITGNLNTPRAGWHTATLLPNGKVLVVGGIVDGDGHTTNSVELYDLINGTWSYTGSLNSAGPLSTPMLLPNGKVIVVDGDRAEQYDPATGSWSITGSADPSSFSFFTAGLLRNGKVLLAGGRELDCFGLCPSKSAELYDPTTRTWTSTGDRNFAGGGDTAVLLPSGRVLVSGPGNNAELYDPATGTWGITANFNTARVGYTETLLSNGKVLVAGGNISGGPGTLNSAELYDPGTNPISNQIDDAQFFVRQHYRDFLNREPDADGFAFWTNEINLCGGDVQCIEVKRINVSASFFISIEFQESGYLVYRFYKASYGNLPAAPVPLMRSEFLPDTQQIGQSVIVNQAGWEQVLENNKQVFASQFVQRARFTSAYPMSMTPDGFVDTLFSNAGVTPTASERTAAIGEFGAATNTADVAARARALQRVAENSTLAQQEFNRAFVLMQYFGYLRRNPNDSPEATLDFQGYKFWLNKLNTFDGNFIDAEMVKAFLSSSEYRQRFAP
jgi:N-acetylneuraminic acid mutarotase